jgi:Na+-translocating ferredoxin:NAD+ oxidoreductase RnfD subunit
MGLLHSRRQIDIAWLMVVVAMSVSSLIFFGHVALSQLLLCLVAAMSAYLPAMLLMWMFHRRPHADSVMHAISMALMVGLLMPINSFPWQHMLAGTFLGIFMPFVGRAHRIRMHPAVLAVIVTWALPLMISNVHEQSSMYMLQTSNQPAVLRPDRVVWGDVRLAREQRSYQPWWLSGEDSLADIDHVAGRHDAIIRPMPHQIFIRDQKRLLRYPRNLANMMASGELPRIEELLLGCVPGMIGTTSQGLLIIMGLYLMYRRLSWWSIPVIIMLSAFLTLMAMPVMLIHGRTTVFWVLIDAHPAFSLTYLGYFFLTSPMLLVAFILAPATSPITALGRLVYCILIGMLMVIFQWFVQIPVLTLMSVLIVGVLSRMLDNLHYRPAR